MKFLYLYLGDYLIASSSRLPPEIFNRAAVSRLCQAHRAGTADHSPVIWLLLMFAAWSELYQPQAVQQPVLSGTGR